MKRNRARKELYQEVSDRLLKDKPYDLDVQLAILEQLDKIYDIANK